jgi:maltose-binding protein MalE
VPETPTHLCLKCRFTWNVWMHLTTHFGRHDLQQSPPPTITRWWKRMRKTFDKKEKTIFDGIMLYFWWNIWKERNRRTFQQSSMEVAEVAFVITNDINLYQHVRTVKELRTTTGSFA